jgi:hypothetical protein
LKRAKGYIKSSPRSVSGGDLIFHYLNSNLHLIAFCFRTMTPL